MRAAKISLVSISLKYGHVSTYEDLRRGLVNSSYDCRPLQDAMLAMSKITQHLDDPRSGDGVEARPVRDVQQGSVARSGKYSRWLIKNENGRPCNQLKTNAQSASLSSADASSFSRAYTRFGNVSQTQLAKGLPNTLSLFDLAYTFGQLQLGSEHKRFANGYKEAQDRCAPVVVLNSLRLAAKTSA